jgi:tetratricopeptide (TPR) repeat protein
MKGGKERISYTWCEYRFATAEGKPHFALIIDDYWPSKDGAEKLWRFRKEIEKEFCPRVKREEIAERTTASLRKNIPDWYSEGKINIKEYCGRRDELKTLFEKIAEGKSIEVYGVGGVGKTALCEIVLLIHKLAGRKILYLGLKEEHTSGTGFKHAYKLSPKRFTDITLHHIAQALGLDTKNFTEDEVIENIITKIEDEEIILFLDNPEESDELKKLIKAGNALQKGCILITTKKEWGLAQFRLPLKGVEDEERVRLVHIIAKERVHKPIKEDDAYNIAKFAEGHPIATYVLVSNLERIDVGRLQNFRKGLDFSKDDDVKEYLDRVIRSALSEEAYSFLEKLSIIEDDIDFETIFEIFPDKNIYGELIDAQILEREGGKIKWVFHQIRQAIVKETIEAHELAFEYYRKRFNRTNSFFDKIKMLYYQLKTGYKNEIFEQFIQLPDSIKEEEWVDIRFLPELGEELKEYVTGERKGIVCGTLGNIYWTISNYKEKAENCKKAIKAYEEALKVYTLERFPMDYAMTQNNLGTAYSTLAEVEAKAENCKKAIKAYEEALKIFTEEKFPEIYSLVAENLKNLLRFCGGDK